MSGIYCEEAAAAEVTFSLTGGREGKIISYNPPVIISLLQGGTCKLVVSGHTWLNIYFHGVISSRIFVNTYPTENYLTIVEETIPPRIIPPEFNIGNLPGVHYCAFYLVFFRTFTPEVNWREQNPVILRKIVDGTFDWFPYGDGNFFGNYAPLYGYNYDDSPVEAGSLFVIQDTKEVLYSFSYLEAPTYQVKCLSCSKGLCPVKTREGVKCFDCKRVLNGLRRVSNNLNKIL
jgi:hypothetical protein